MSEQGNAQNNRSIELCKRVVTTDSFVTEAKEVYGDCYDYSKVNYINKEHRVTVVCPVHGDFKVYAREHLDGKGCPKCEKGEKFVKKLKDRFGDKFGLEEFCYESSTFPITLVCPVHGSFSKLPNAILGSRFGCPECGNEYLQQLQAKAHQDAIDHKEERDMARKEKYRAKVEAKRLAEKTFAKEKWDERIRKILAEGEKVSDESTLDSFEKETEQLWYEDFFGFNLKAFTLDDGTMVDGKEHFFPKIVHRPIWEVKVDANQGDLTQATFYIHTLEDKELFELLLVFEHILSYGYFNSLEQIKEKYESVKDMDFSVDGVRDGYKFCLTKQWSYIKLKIRKIGAKSRIRHDYQFSHITNLPKSFVAIDFETLYPQRVSACSVGMVKYRDGEIVDRYYTLIRPPFDYPGKCGKVLTWVHGLTEEMVRDAKTFEELLPEMETFVDGLPLVAHHACVEKACIRDTCAFYGIDTSLDYEGIYDTLDLSRRAEAKLGISEEGPGTHQLDAVCRRFGISGDNHHHALADAEMSGNLMLVFQKVFEGAESVEVKESEPAANGVFTPRQKYNPEDMIQRTDLENVPDNPFKNKVVVLTGFAKADSKEYAHQLNEFGAIIKDGVNKKTNILITGYNAGPAKMQKAEELGVRIMPEAEYKEIISHLNK